MNPYAVLEISSRATEEEVRKAYRDMAKKWHPDRKLDDQETATKKFMEIDAAYRVILREYRREAKKHSSSSSSSPSSSTSTSLKQTTNSHTIRDNHSIHSKTKNTDPEQLDPLHSGNFRVENVDLLHDQSGCRAESNKDKDKSKSGSRPSTADSQESSSTLTTVSLSSFSSSSLTSSTSSWSSPSSDSSKSSPDSAKAGPLKKTSHTSNPPASMSSIEAQEKQKQEVDHVSSTMPPPPPSFTFSTTSSEVSAYDNTEITLPPRASAVIVYEDGAEMNETEIEPAPVMTTDTATTAVSSVRPTEEEGTDTRGAGPDSAKNQDKHSKMYSSKKSRRESSSSSKKKDHKHEHEERTLIPEFDSPLARSVGVLHQWTYTIRLTLTDLFHGKKLRFRVLRCKLSGKRKTILLNVNIPPGSMHRTQVIFKSAGHENADGTRQDIHFIIEEEKHEKFKRVGDDLVLDVRLLWSEGLKKEKGVVNVTGLLDGSEREFEVDFVGEGNVVGVERIEGAGMPVFGAERKRRGCLIVRWEIFMPEPKTKWETLKQVLRL